MKITHWRVYQSLDGRRFALRRVGMAIEGRLLFDPATLLVRRVATT
jgi:hypothetical protein